MNMVRIVFGFPELSDESVSDKIVNITIPNYLSAGIEAFSKALGLSDEIIWIGAYGLLLSRYTDCDQTVFALSESKSDVEINGLIQKLPLGLHPKSEDQVEKYLQEIPEVISNFRENLEKNIKGNQVSEPVEPIDTLLVLSETPQERYFGINTQAQNGDNLTENYALIFVIGKTEEERWLQVIYDESRFDRHSILAFIDSYQWLLEQIIADASQSIQALQLLRPEEYQRLVVDWNQTAVDFPIDLSVLALFEARVALAPNKIAVEQGDCSLSYAQLNNLAAKMAGVLRGKGLKSGEIVVVHWPRSPTWIATLLAIWKVGGVYLPVDAAIPAERLRFILQDSQAKLLVTQEEGKRLAFLPPEQVVFWDDELPLKNYSSESVAPLTDEFTANEVKNSDRAYIIYTSGSQGQPKGVVVCQGNLLNLIFWHRRARGVSERDRGSQIAGLGFDASIIEVWPYLSAGATLCLPDFPLPVPAWELRDWLVAKNITVAFVPTPLTEDLLAETWPSTIALRTLFTAGDRLNIRPPSNLPFQLINDYGPAENTVAATCQPVASEGRGYPPIGRPIDNVKAYILDRYLRPVPIGVPGELHLSGASLAEGYLHRPELTKEKFIRNPFAEGTSSARMYKTGDRVRYLPDGKIEWIGRIDNQLKIRGVRIELREIETAILAASPAVKQAIVILREIESEKRLIAYFTTIAPHPDNIPELIAKIREILSHQLLPQMLPSAFVVLETFPLTANGKIDRRALPAPEFPMDDFPSTYLPPRNALESRLAKIWQTILKRERVGVKEDFFTLGGDSLQAVRILSQLRNEGIDLATQDFFVKPEIAAIATHIKVRENHQNNKTDLPASGNSRTQDLASFIASQIEIKTASDQQQTWLQEKLTTAVDAYPLSPLQHGILFHTLHQPEEWTYLVQIGLTLDGELDCTILQTAFDIVVKRHPILQSSFHWEGLRQPLQIVNSEVRLPWVNLDWSEVSTEVQSQQWEDFVIQDRARGFELTQAPLLRVTLIRYGDNCHRLLCSQMHLLMAEWEVFLVFDEVFRTYKILQQGKTDSLPRPRRFGDFIKNLDSLNSEAAAAFWQARLDGYEPSPLSFGFPQGDAKSGRHEKVEFRLPQHISEQLADFARSQRVTVNAILTAVFSILLGRYMDRSDVVFGLTLSGRTQLPAGMEETIGLFINTLPLRLSPTSELSVQDFLQATRDAVFSLNDYEQSSLADVHRWSGLKNLFDTILVFDEESLDCHLNRWVEGLSFREFEVYERSNYALTFAIIKDEELLVQAIYDESRFDRSSIKAFLESYQWLLEQVIADGSQSLQSLQLLRTEEYQCLVVDWNQTAVDFSRDSGILASFAERVTLAPKKIAIEQGERFFSYEQLNNLATRMADVLREKGLQPGDIVVVHLPRSPEWIATLLGIWKVGGVYLPVDAAIPTERLRFILEDSRAQLLVSQENGVGVTFLAPERVVVWEDKDLVLTEKYSSLEKDYFRLEEEPACIIYTSGSTGQPKGVVLTQGSLNNFVSWFCRQLELTPSDRGTQVAGLGFDATIMEVWTYLAVGGTICLPDFEIPAPAEEFRDWVIERQITTINFLVTPLATELLKLTWPPHSDLRLMTTGGESLKMQPPRGLSFSLFNAYGPTENTVFSTFGQVAPRGAEDRVLPSIGRPIANVQTYILDRQQRPLPIGVAGELYLGGKNLARGYLNLPDLTQERFVSNPFTDSPAQLYRTGDLVRYLPNGEIDFIGRRDYQVQIRGLRVELGEIETAIEESVAVVEKAIVVLCGGKKNPYLAAYLTAKANLSPEALRREIRDSLALRLPRQMLPATLTILEAFPLNPNGKIDRKALPEPERERELTSPRNNIEERICNIWEDILELEQVGIQEDFFALGGNSLHATRLLSRLCDAFEIEMSLPEVFEAQTIAELAHLIQQGQRKSRSSWQLHPVRRQPGDALPLSYAQQRLWFLDALNPESSAYNVVAYFYLQGDLNIAALKAALNDLVKRHEILRARFDVKGGEPFQVIETHRSVILEELSLPPGQEFLSFTRTLLEAEALRKVNLREDCLARFLLLDGLLGTRALIVSIHHIVFDGWSLGVFLEELSLAYKARCGDRSPTFPPLPIQYPDFAIAQKQWMSDFLEAQQLPYWLEQLADLAPLGLPFDRPRPFPPGFRGRCEKLVISPELTTKLEALCREENITLFMGLLTSYYILLYRYCNQEDIALASPIANRNAQEIEGIVGFFVNTLVLRCKISGDLSFRDLLQQVRQMTLEAYRYQDLPFNRLVEVLQPDRSSISNPLVQTVFALQNSPTAPLQLLKLPPAPTCFEAFTTRFDLEFHLWRVDGGISSEMVYNPDLFEPETIQRLLRHYHRILEAIVQDIERPVVGIPLLEDREKNDILRLGRGPRVSVTKSVHKLFEEGVGQYPENIAVIDNGGKTLSYQDLNERANRWAWALRDRGIQPGQAIAICIPRQADLIIALLAILKTGSFYVALDPANPKERNAFILETLGVRVILTTTQTREEIALDGYEILVLDDSEFSRSALEQSNENIDIASTPEELCYVAFTSGSTGQPKGVSIPHRGVVRLAKEPNYLRLDPSERMLGFAPLAFDASTLEIWGTLLNGATLILAPPGQPSLAELGRWIREQKVTTAWFTAGLFHLFMKERPEDLRQLRQLLAGGDVLQPSAVNRALKQNPEGLVINGYGPTENTTFTCCHVMQYPEEYQEKVPIGKPINGTQVYILDEALALVPLGAVGELYVAGDGLARDYWGLPDLTSDRFLRDRFSTLSEAKMYRTGDLVRMRSDGTVEFIGRGDDMIKIRGFRIEPKEIERVLSNHPAVAETVVLTAAIGGEKRLVSYIAPQKASPEKVSSEREQVEQWSRTFDELIYRDIDQAGDGKFNTAGWMNSYTGERIADEEMAVWVQNRVDSITAHHPRSIVELGCGTGLLLLRLARDTKHYIGTDISRSALSRLQEEIEISGDYGDVELLQQPAHEFDKIASFDFGILNSTVQYFPSLTYLEEVLQEAFSCMEKGGCFFLGDLRSLPLLPLFHLSVQTARAPEHISIRELADRARRALEEEPELAIDPAFFFNLQQRFPRISSVRVEPQRGRIHNELNRFRYDVFLYLDGVQPIPLDWLDWNAQVGKVGIEAVRHRLEQERPERIAYCRIPNARLMGEETLQRILESDERSLSVGKLRERAKVAGGIDPEDLIELGENAGYRVELSCGNSNWATTLDVCFIRRDCPYVPIAFPEPMVDASSPEVWGNTPGWKQRTTELRKTLRQYLEQSLPSYMIPTEWVFLRSFPLNDRGKLDRQSLIKHLPQTPLSAPTLSFLPGNELEQRISAIWREILQQDSFGIDDNFFEVGGHSLLVIQVCDRLSKALKCDVTPVEMFQHPTIHKMATYLAAGKNGQVGESSRSVSFSGSESPSQTDEAIAIVGIAGRFPGAEDISSFWENLKNGVESIVSFSDEELRQFGVPDSSLGHPDYLKTRGRLKSAFEFDADFFGYSAREAEFMDPQHRIFLECVYMALEDAGYDPHRYPGSIGIYGGTGDTTYLHYILAHAEDVPATARETQAFFGNYRDFMVTKTAYKLNFRGPAIAVQTACSTSLVSVILASQALLAGQGDLMVAGGCSIRIPHGSQYQPGGVLSPDGACRAFDRQAQGTVMGDGCAIVVLKRLSEALAEGDRIYGVIRGFGLNNDGQDKMGYTAPGVTGQTAAIAAAQAMAGGNVEDITYIETHGTGTPLGDPIEITALTAAFRQKTQRKQFCALGAVKTNIGHLDAAAGTAGLIKTLLALKYAEIPPSLHFQEPNPKIDFANSPFFVQSRLGSWPQGDRPRRAGVSSFGIGGTNAHIIVEEAPSLPVNPSLIRPYQLLPFSARTPEALRQTCQNVVTYLQQHPESSLADAALTLQVGRGEFAHRRFLVGKSADELAAWQEAKAVEVESDRSPSLAFLFPGQGSQYMGMGWDLYENEPVFRTALEKCRDLVQSEFDWDLLALLYPENIDSSSSGNPVEQLRQTRFSQPALFAIEYALSQLLEAWGIRPAAFLGHSIGEIVAAHLAGVFDLPDALELTLVRGEVMAKMPPGAMLSLDATEEEAREFLRQGQYQRLVAISVLNAPNVTVLSGTCEAIDELQQKWKNQGRICRLVQTSHAFHSPMMEGCLPEVRNRLEQIRFHRPHLPFISNVTGDWADPEIVCLPDYWLRHLREPVRYADGVSKLLSDSDRILLEVGPGNVLSTLAGRQLSSRNPQELGRLLTTLRHPRETVNDVQKLLQTLGSLWQLGVAIDWKAFGHDQPCHRMSLPTYPFERRSHLFLPRSPLDSSKSSSHEPSTPDSPTENLVPLSKKPDIADWFYVPRWEPRPLSEGEVLPLGNCWLWANDTEFSRVIATTIADRYGSSGVACLILLAGEEFEQLDSRTFRFCPSVGEDFDRLLGETSSPPTHIVYLRGFTPSLKYHHRADEYYQDLLFLVQALGRLPLEQQFALTIATNYQHIVEQGEFLCPEKATLLGPGLVIPVEYPNIRCQNLDWATDVLDLDFLFAEMERWHPEDRVVAYRSDRRWMRQFVPQAVNPLDTPSIPLKPKGVYLITGGLGGVGLHIARHLIGDYGAKVALTGRSFFPEPKDWEAYLSDRIQGVLADWGDSLAKEETELYRISNIQGIRERCDVYDGLIQMSLSCAYHYLKQAWDSDRHPASREEWRQILRIQPQFQRFFEFMLRLLSQHELLSFQGNSPKLFEAESLPTPDVIKEQLSQKFPEFRGQFRLLHHCYEHYGPALAGDIPAIGVIYPEGRGDFLRQCMADTEEYSFERIYRQLIVQLLPRIQPTAPGRTFRILEIGAGNGLLTWELVPHCQGQNIEYHFTDLGNNFVLKAQEQAQQKGFEFMKFAVFDISRDGREQGFNYESFDLIVGLNVVHTTPRIDETLFHLQNLLAPKGILALIESPRSEPWIDLVWGLAEGWWYFQDERNFGTGSPLLSLEHWEMAYSRLGLQDIQSYPRDIQRRETTDIGMVLGQKKASSDRSTHWLAELSPDELLKNRIRRLQSWRDAGAEVKVYQADVTDEARMQEVIQDIQEGYGPINGIIHAAFILQDAMMQFKKTESAKAVMAPKIEGAYILDRLLADCPPDFVVHCSSLASVVGLYAQSDYCAANAFLDAWATQKTAEGLPSLAINWGIWRNTGAAMQMVMKKAINKTATRWVDLPLFDYCFDTEIGQSIYASCFTPNKDWVVGEHRLHDVATLPGTALLEMARSACEYHGNWPQLELYDVYFFELLTVVAGGETFVRTILTRPQEQGEVLTFAIESLSFNEGQSQWKKHAVGRARPLLGEPGAISIAPLRDICTQTVEVDLKTGPVVLGDRWQQSLKSVSLGEGEALGEFHLPESSHGDLAEYKLHPALLDLATGFALGDGPLYLPYRYGSVRVWRSLPAKFYCHARFRSDTTSGEADLSYDFTLFDETGTELANIREYRLQPVSIEESTSPEVKLPLQVEARAYYPTTTEKAFAAITIVGTATVNQNEICDGDPVVAFIPQQEPSAAMVTPALEPVLFPLHCQLNYELVTAYLPDYILAVYTLKYLTSWHPGQNLLIWGVDCGWGQAVLGVANELAAQRGGQIFVLHENGERTMAKDLANIQFLASEALSHAPAIREQTTDGRGINVLLLLRTLPKEQEQLLPGILAPYGSLILGLDVSAPILTAAEFLSQRSLTLARIRLDLEFPHFNTLYEEAVTSLGVARGLLSPMLLPLERDREAMDKVRLRQRTVVLSANAPEIQALDSKQHTVMDVLGISGLYPELEEGMHASEGVEAFLRVLERGFSQVVVSTQDLLELIRHNRNDYILKHKQVALGLMKADSLDITPTVAATDVLEQTLLEIWHDILGVENIRLQDSFFDLNGDSLLAIKMISQVRERLGADLTPNVLFKNPTIENLVQLLRQRGKQTEPSSSPLNLLHSSDIGIPTFFIHPIGGTSFCYVPLASHWPLDGAFYAFESLGLEGDTPPLTQVEEMARAYIEEIQRVRPHGPYRLGGWSLGGLISFEIARQLQARGEEIESLILIDSTAPTTVRQIPTEVHQTPIKYSTIDSNLLGSLLADLGGLKGQAFAERDLLSHLKAATASEQELLDAALKQAQDMQILSTDVDRDRLEHLLRVFQANHTALLDYSCPEPLQSESTRAIAFFARERDSQVVTTEVTNWQQALPNNLEVHLMPADHYSILQGQNCEQLLAHLSQWVREESLEP